MNADQHLVRLQRPLAMQRLAIALVVGVPPLLALVILAGRVAGMALATVVGVVAALALGVVVRRAWRIDPAAFARRLDARVPAMDDSAALLFRDPATLSAMQRLQQARLRTRLAEVRTDLRPAWPWLWMIASMLGTFVLLGLAAIGPLSRPDTSLADAAKPAPALRGSTIIARASLTITAPAYTHLPARTETTLDAKALQGSQLRWRLRFEPTPQAVTLAFHDGSRLALRRDAQDWIGERTLAASTLYRIELDGVPALAEDRLFRLDAIADRAPEIRVLRPDRTLSLLEDGQTHWDLEFEASDDFGIGHAELAITLAQGSGENIAFSDQTLTLSGEPIATPPTASALNPSPAQPPTVSMRYRHSLDLAALKLSKGDEVIVRLAVSDQREPQANTTRSPSLILRWPEDPSSESAELEGIAQRVMPAYFRSQRQIIIDAETLLAEQPTLAADPFLARSDSIGVDQKILRLRYGQFLGEESETQAAHAPADTGDTPTQIDALSAVHEAQEQQRLEYAPEKFGAEGNTLAEYGHVHDLAEAATLLDAETRATLKSALGEMWQSELHLRQGDPAAALPYAHRALEFIKQVQQSTRIHLSRVGLELPPPDETRRLSGDREGLLDRSGSLRAEPDAEAPIVALWQALAEPTTPDWQAADAWLREHEARVPEALGVLAAIDAARRDPDCLQCREAVRDLLWPLLPVPAARSAPRPQPDASGRAYLDALQADPPGESAR